MKLKTGDSVGPYEIIRPLGEGGMGEVYEAKDVRLGRNIAVKLLPDSQRVKPEAVERFGREARSASALNHPHIVTIYDIGECESGVFIAMELVNGRTLREATGSGITLPDIAACGEQIARALAASHLAGVTHRDIKPENIMIREDGYAKLLDFGLASLTSLQEGDTAATFTATGAVMGTLRYMSPEQAKGARCGPATDIFSLGIVLYEATTGRHPFPGESALMAVHSMLADRAEHPRTWNAQIPESLADLLLAMLEKDEVRRPEAAQVASALQHTLWPQDSSEPVFQAISRRTIIGREADREVLREAFRLAVNGRGSFITIAGEPGIGKTTLVDEFLLEVASSGTNCAIARGRCSERLAGTEAYLPVLEAMEGLIEGSGRRTATVEAMRSFAPSWYVQISSLNPADSANAPLMSEARSGSQERMKREIGVLLQEIARHQPVIMFLDDLHWADNSTVDVLSYLSARLSSSRILLLATYRLTDMLLVKHPMLRLRTDLQARGLCKELTLEFLTRRDIEQYLSVEFPGHRFGPQLADMIHIKTEGNALFMTDLVRYLRDCGVIAQIEGAWLLAREIPDVQKDLPQSVRAMVEQKISQLGEEDLRLLTVASVQGYVFDSALLSTVLQADPAHVEERLGELDRVLRFVRAVEETELPDHTLTVRYRFVHVLYQNALYASLRPTRRAALNQSVAEALVSHYGTKTEVIANNLAVLFQAGRNFLKAAEFFRMASQHAVQVFASREAVALSRRGLEALGQAPACAQRNEIEVALLITLGNSLIATEGYAAPEVSNTFQRARDVCTAVGEKSVLLPVLYGEWVSEFVGGNHYHAMELSRGFIDLAAAEKHDALVVGWRMLGWGQFCTGQLEASRESYEKAIQMWNPRHRILAFSCGHEPGMAACSNLAMALWLLGRYAEAEDLCVQALRLGEEVQHPNSRAYGFVFAAVYACWLGDFKRALQYADSALSLAQDQGLALWKGWSELLRGRALAGLGLAMDSGTDLKGSYAAVLNTGTGLFATYYLWVLAEVDRMRGLFASSFAHLEQSFAAADKTGETFWIPELHRLRGKVLLESGADKAEAEKAFHCAISAARQQKSRSLEQRAAQSLSELLGNGPNGRYTAL